MLFRSQAIGASALSLSRLLSLARALSRCPSDSLPPSLSLFHAHSHHADKGVNKRLVQVTNLESLALFVSLFLSLSLSLSLFLSRSLSPTDTDTHHADKGVNKRLAQVTNLKGLALLRLGAHRHRELCQQLVRNGMVARVIVCRHCMCDKTLYV